MPDAVRVTRRADVGARREVPLRAWAGAEHRAAQLSSVALALTASVGGVRYHSVHAADVDHHAVVALAALVALGATGLALGASCLQVARALALGLALGTVALVLLAPSTAWVVVPLVVTLQATTSVVVATVAGGLAVSAVVVSVPRLAASADVGLLVACALAGLVFLVAVALARASLDARDRTVQELSASRAQTSEAERRAEHLEARRHLSAELHDTVVQSVAGALLLAEAAERTGDASHATAARRALRVAVEETRALVDDLEQDQSGALALEAELRSAAARVGATWSTTGVRRDLSAEGALAVLRAAQGALGNAERHSAAARIELELRYEEAGVVLTVSDDGVGFDPDALPAPGPRGGHGLAIARRRLEAVGGRLVVRSSAIGTLVEASVPGSRS